MQESASYIKDTTDFQDKIKNPRVPEDAFLVTADVVGLDPNIPHEAVLIEFDRSVYQQVSGTAIGTKFAPPYACIFMDRLKNEFLDTQILKPLVWFRYIDDIFFIWMHSEKELKNLWEN